MAENRYVTFIERIIQLTKERKINWNYLDTNEELYIGMEWTNTKVEYRFLSENKEIITPNFNTEDSFFARVDDTYLAIYVWNNQPAKFYVIPYTFKKVTVFTPDEYGEYITRLSNLVQSQFPNSENFIDGVLSKGI